MKDDRPTADDQVSVLLIDDHTLSRDGLRRLLEGDPGITVVGEATDGDSAVSLALALRPHVIVLDDPLPGGDGLIVMTRLRTALPDVRVLIVSPRDQEPLVRQALAAGARGYVVKHAPDVNLAHAVRLVASSEVVVIPRHLTTSRAPAAGSRLTKRELEVLALICRGLSSRAIAAELGLSVFTVRVHRAGIMRTLNIHRTTALVAYAVQHRLVSVRP